MRRSSFLLYTAIAIVVFLPLNSVKAEKNDLDVPLTVQENAHVTRTQEIVSTGVPLPRSQQIKRVKDLQVVNAKGKSVPVQFTVLARWGAGPQDSSAPIKWVLVEFPVHHLKSGGKQVYHLQNGNRHALVKAPVRVHKSKNTFSITTGKARFILDKRRFNLLDQVYMNKHPLLDEDNSPGAVIESSNGTATTRNGEVERIHIDRQGPLHTIVTVKGDHRTDSGEKILVYTARLHFYANSSAVRVEYSVWNDNKIVNVNGQPDIKEFNSPNAVHFDSLTLQTNLRTGNNERFQMGGAAKQVWKGDISSNATLYQDSSGGPRWNDERNFAQNTFRGFTSEANGNTLHGVCSESQSASDCRALGWIDGSSSQGGLAVGVEDFWQNYPKGLEVKKDGTVSVELFPEQYAENFTLRVGEQKTHDILYYFHRDIKTKRLRTAMVAFNNPLHAWAPSSWYVNDAKVFHDSVSRNPSDFPQFEGYVDAAIQYKDANLLTVPDGINGTGWLYGDRPESLGWSNYGDRIAEDESGSGAVYTNLQYDHTLAFVYQFVRSISSGKQLARDWWSLAKPTMRHQVDSDTVHSRCAGQSVTEMEKCMDPSTPTPIGWTMGSRLTNTWHADPNSDEEHRHALIDAWAGGNAGLIYYYYLTGDLLARDGFVEEGKNAAWKAENTGCNADSSTDCGPGYGASSPHITYADWQREGAYLLEMNTKTFEATGNKRYLKAAQDIVQAMNPKGMWFADSSFTLNSNTPSGDTYTPWATGMMMKSLGFYIDTYKEYYDGKTDSTAQDILLQYAQITTKFWQLGADEPTQYRIYSNGGYYSEEADPFNIAVADGLAWALEVDDGRLDRSKTDAVLREAFTNGSRQWGKGYVENTFTTIKTHVAQMINGWKSMKYLQTH